MSTRVLVLLLLGAVGCEPNVVDAVRKPPPVVIEKPPEPPDPPLVTSLAHRYSFDEPGLVALDTKNAAHGQVLGTELPGDGTLPLAGDYSAEYVNLPNGLIHVLSAATFEAWLTWNTMGVWQRIFDFGNSTMGEDIAEAGSSYLFLTTNAAADTTRMLPGGMRVAYSHNGVGDEDVCYGPDPFPLGVETHVAVVIDPDAKSITLYQDGAFVAECMLTRTLSTIDDKNNWLGHSNFKNDRDLSGIYDEFRIYSAALTAAEIADSYEAGPDAQP